MDFSHIVVFYIFNTIFDFGDNKTLIADNFSIWKNYRQYSYIKRKKNSFKKNRLYDYFINYNYIFLAIKNVVFSRISNRKIYESI